jgi:hypothetical protein
LAVPYSPEFRHVTHNAALMRQVAEMTGGRVLSATDPELVDLFYRGDLIVPFEAQQELRDTMGVPEALYLPTGHRTSFIYFPMIRNAAFEFFQRKFDGSDSDPQLAHTEP